jgi:cytoskeletal protein RodZ
MGKAVGGLPETVALIAAGQASDSVGAYIARQRKLRGISLEELEGLTRIPRRSLERLESGAFDAAPDGFVRGFVRTVSIAIGLDPDDTVSRMLTEPDPRGGKRRVPNLSSAAVFVLLVLLVAFGAGILWVLAEIRPGELAELSRAPEIARVRRDAVRELAISRGIIPETASAGARPIVPTEASPPD